MARIRRLTTIAGVAALASSFVIGPAQASTPEVFEGTAAGTALDLSVLGKQLTLGAAGARADSTGKADARGTGVLGPSIKTSNSTVDNALPSVSTEKIATASNGSQDVKPKSCGAGVSLPDQTVSGRTLELSKVLSVGLACSAAEAKSGAAPSASGEGSVAEAGVNAATLIQEVEEATNTNVADDTIGPTVAGLLDPVCTALAGQDQGVSCNAGTTIKDLVESVLHTETLDIEAGKATSAVTTSAGAVTAKATASGATVKILPLPQVDGLPSTEPVVTIRVGASQATVTYDRAGGKAAATADPAIVRITFNTVLTDALAERVGDLPVGRLNDIVITPQDFPDLQKALDDQLKDEAPMLITVCEDGRAVCILPGSPLESKIFLATSRTTADGGKATAVADAVRLDLVTGIDFTNVAGQNVNKAANLDLTTPGVRLALAGVQAGVQGQPGDGEGPDDGDDGNRNVPPVRTELDRSGGPLPPLELPRTGGLPLLPMLGAGALTLAGALRRATRKAAG